jgi:hypothetical protein
MYTLIRNVGLRRGLVAEAPSLTLSIVTAEFFYKFHSFTLECIAFLATWFVLSYLFALAFGTLAVKQKPQG